MHFKGVFLHCFALRTRLNSYGYYAPPCLKLIKNQLV